MILNVSYLYISIGFVLSHNSKYRENIIFHQCILIEGLSLENI
jgi:hypothetical protein